MQVYSCTPVERPATSKRRHLPADYGGHSTYMVSRWELPRHNHKSMQLLFEGGHL